MTAVAAHAAAARRRLRARPGRALLSAVGILLAAAMAGAAVTVAYGLSTGFERSARLADMPDIRVSFDALPLQRIDAVLRPLPNLADRAYRLELGSVGLAARTGATSDGTVEAVAGPRRGYAIVAGRDVRDGEDQIVVERGLARAWHLRVGDRLDVGSLGSRRIAGVAVAPDDVAYPLASTPHVYLSRTWLEHDVAFRRLPVNQALIWAHDRANAGVLLQQARATSFGVRDVRFVTRDGVRVLLAQAGGVVIALLVGFSLVALAAAAAMLGASARVDVERRVATIGLQRALGVSRGAVAAEHGAAGAALALVAGSLGVAAGALLAAGPASDLLMALNEQPPGWALAGPLALTVAAIALLVGAATAWPAWKAAGRPPIALLRGGELAAGAPPRRPAGRAGPVTLGVRLVAARRARTAAAVAVLAASGAVILLMLGLAQLVAALRDDPGSVGKRYALTVAAPPGRLPAIRRVPGVGDAGARWIARGADSFSLGEPVKLVAFGGDHTRFEDPPLAAGRRLRADDEAEVGLGLAHALGLGLSSTLAVQLAGGEARFRVVGIVRALDDSGRIAYVRPARVLAAAPGLDAELVVRLRPGADRAAVAARVARAANPPNATGPPPAPATVGGATTRNASFLGTLAALLRAVALVDALVCLYALVQGLALVTRERRPTLALLRALGAGPLSIAVVLAGAALAVAVPAAVLAVALEDLVLAPLVGRLAAGYADLSPALGAAASALAALGLVVLALIAAAWVARGVLREPPVAGLRED